MIEPQRSCHCQVIQLAATKPTVCSSGETYLTQCWNLWLTKKRKKKEHNEKKTEAVAWGNSVSKETPIEPRKAGNLSSQPQLQTSQKYSLHQILINVL